MQDFKHLGILCTACSAGSFLLCSAATAEQLVANPTNKPDCMNNTAFFNPNPATPSIDLPAGFKASVFAAGLNMPTGIAFRRRREQLPGVCPRIRAWSAQRVQRRSGVAGWCTFAANNPFTPDILVFNQEREIDPRPAWASQHPPGAGLQPSGPAVDIGFVNGFSGGRLFATNSNQSTHAHDGAEQQFTHRHSEPDDGAGYLRSLPNLPTGDHPTEQLAFKGGWIYWSQGSTTNSGVVGLDNGGGAKPARYSVPGHHAER